MTVASELLGAGIYSAVYVGVLALANLVRKLLPHETEISRKTAHLASGAASVFLPLLVRSPVTAVILCALFLVILWFTRKTSAMSAVHGVKRSTIGSYLFPLAVCILYIVARNAYPYYVASILVLTMSDTAAALVGINYGHFRFTMKNEWKSVEGSFAFGVIAFLCVHLPLLLMTTMQRAQCVLISLIAAVTVTAFELVSLRGTDNLFVPLGTYFIVDRMGICTWDRNVETVVWLAIAIAVVLALFGRSRRFKPEYKLIMILFDFGAMGLGGWFWFLPVFLCQTLLAVVLSRLPVEGAEDAYRPGYGSAFGLMSGLFPVYIVAIMTFRHRDLFPVFLAGVTAAYAALATLYCRPIGEWPSRIAVFSLILAAHTAFAAAGWALSGYGFDALRLLAGAACALAAGLGAVSVTAAVVRRTAPRRTEAVWSIGSGIGGGAACAAMSILVFGGIV